MIVLSGIYSIFGMILFNKRKMENLGTSFVSNKIHYIVKGLTVLPMIFIANIIEAEGSALLIIGTLIFIYYIIYDFIVSKKIKFKYSLVSFVLTILILQGTIMAETKLQDYQYRGYTIDDIDGIAIEKNLNISLKEDEYIHDEKVISEIFEKLNESQVAINSRNNVYTNIDIKLKNGNVGKIYAPINIKFLREIQEKYSKENNENIEFKEIKFIANGKFLSDEDNKRINEILESQNYKFETNDIRMSSIELNSYYNHSVVWIDISNIDNDEIKNIAIKNSNKYSYDNLKTKEIYDGRISIKEIKDGKIIQTQYTYANVISNELIEYIKVHYNDTVNFSGKIVEIDIYDSSRGLNIYLELTEELENIIFNNNLTWEFENYLENNDVYDGEIMY